MTTAQTHDSIITVTIPFTPYVKYTPVDSVKATRTRRLDYVLEGDREEVLFSLGALVELGYRITDNLSECVSRRSTAKGSMIIVVENDSKHYSVFVTNNLSDNVYDVVRNPNIKPNIAPVLGSGTRYTRYSGLNSTTTSRILNLLV